MSPPGYPEVGRVQRRRRTTKPLWLNLPGKRAAWVWPRDEPAGDGAHGGFVFVTAEVPPSGERVRLGLEPRLLVAAPLLITRFLLVGLIAAQFTPTVPVLIAELYESTLVI